MEKINLTEDELVEGKHCLDLEIPWMVPEAVYKLDEVLKKEDVVIEYGVGGSTFFFANRCRGVMGFETDKEFHAVVSEKAEKEGCGKKIEVMNFSDYGELIGREYMHQEGPTVLSVDPQGHINRSEILNEILKNGNGNLRIIILDNYAHPQLFPDHYDKGNFMGDEWEMFTYDHPRWAGAGTRIFLKK